MTFSFDNSYARLPDHFYAPLRPTPVKTPGLIKVNHDLARELGIDPSSLDGDAVEIFSGNRLPDGAEPIAMAYAGHQFGGWSPQLGDGRAILLGEVIDVAGRRRDIQLKGSGPTPFSRNGDGRAWVGPVLREYVVSEAMSALGVPTTRALAAVTTGEPVFREDVLPGAVLARVAASHIRVGTFQYFAGQGDVYALRQLADYVIDRHYPNAARSDNPVLSLLEAIVDAQATLIAKWMAVGFIHGVMNTDNMAVSGETIDYGPCAFMDAYHPATVFSSIDSQGRYAYQNQPTIGVWNLSQLASALLPLINTDEAKAVEAATDVIGTFSPRFDAAWASAFRAKIGLARDHDGDDQLIRDLMDEMATQGADFTLTFRKLGDGTARELFVNRQGFDDWTARWQTRRDAENKDPADVKAAMDAVNPAYIPRNHRMEHMIAAAVDGDFQPFERALDILSRPYDDQPENIDFQNPPRREEIVRETFCGT